MKIKDMYNKMREIKESMVALNDSEAFNQEEWDKLQAEWDSLDAAVKEAEKRQEKIDSMNAVFSTGVSAPAAKSIQVGAVTGPQVKDKDEPIFASLGEQLVAVAAVSTSADIGYAKDVAHNKLDRLAETVTNVIQSQNPNNAGLLVQTEYSRALRETAIEAGVLASRVSRQPIGANFDSYSYMEIRGRKHNLGVLNGGIPVYRKGEGETMRPGVGLDIVERHMNLMDMYGLIYVSNQMLRDAVALEGYVKRAYPKSFGFKLDTEILNGSGANECLGIMNSPMLVTVAKEAGQAAGTITSMNISKMWDRLPIANRRNAIWFVGEGIEPQLQHLQIGEMPVYLQPGGFSNSPYGMLFGRPVIPFEMCEEIGNKGDIILADLKEYLLIEKNGMVADSSIHVRFLEDETAFRFIQRNNGQPIDCEPITPVKGQLKKSPFVVLETRA